MEIVSGIICNKCGNTLPPHSVDRHLDIDDSIHKCPHIDWKCEKCVILYHGKKCYYECCCEEDRLTKLNDNQKSIEKLSILKKPKKKNEIIEIDFIKPLDIEDVIQYKKLPNELYWNRREDDKIVGIYFERKNCDRLRDEINNILWFFGEFEEEEDQNKFY